MEEAGRSAIVQHERRTVTPLAREAPKRHLFKERELEREQPEATSREEEPEKGQAAEGSEVGSSERERSKRREPGISRAEILTEVVDPSFRMPDLPKYDGTKDPQEHIAAFELGEGETLKKFIGRFNNETLEVQDLRIDMMVSILIHGLRKGPLASALARDPPEDVEQLMRVAQKYIDEEEINAMKDEEWKKSRDRGRWKDNREKYVRAEKEREPPYRPKFHRYTPLATTRTRALMMVEKSDLLQWPQPTRFTSAKRFSNKYYRFHRENGHDTEECYQLKDEIERLRKGYGERGGSQDDPMAIKLDIANFSVHKVLVDNGSSADIVFWDVIKRMGLENAQLDTVHTPLVGFGGSEVVSMGTITLPVSMGEEPRRKTLMVRFLVVDTPFAYNVILGRPGLNAFRAVVSTYHQKMKFPTKNGIGEVTCDQKKARRCYNLSLKKGEGSEKLERKEKEDPKGPEQKKFKPERMEPVEEFKTVELIAHQPEKTTMIGSKMSKVVETMMIEFLRENVDMFAWSPSDFRVIDPEVIVHRLNVDPMMRPMKQKKKTFGAERNKIIEEEVKKLLEAGYVSEVQYTDWLANVVVVPKASGKWRMCTDFTDLNKACPKDPYPLPRIDLLVDSTAGYELFSMMDAYQGYHQIFMAEEDRIKTSFITDQGIYCYNVMPFGLKNAGATYQRLVN
ncbi:UNVERIFIED_CONTAM: Retrovirus-related Pol polyprotein from transposon gypsy [Sesamum radiatum]|uniref:Retrovirus-related Pol polyprotein from transposon gypsy n=1 Tax=Sesamum radiatum TaxID=300843 RepID=A0AAW2U8D9_SESRA